MRTCNNKENLLTVRSCIMPFNLISENIKIMEMFLFYVRPVRSREAAVLPFNPTQTHTLSGWAGSDTILFHLAHTHVQAVWCPLPRARESAARFQPVWFSIRNIKITANRDFH